MSKYGVKSTEKNIQIHTFIQFPKAMEKQNCDKKQKMCKSKINAFKIT